MSSEKQVPEALVGTVLDGRYRIEGLLGEGGMGAVCAATDVKLGKPVAVKVMGRHLAANHEALARFQREARATSRLGHPHIVQVNDSGTAPTGEPFLVMEFLAGEDLQHRLRRVGSLSSADALHVVKQVASALAVTHANGIVHRDLKPANVYLLEFPGESDFVKVLDFGIAKLHEPGDDFLTRTGAIFGTATYMSPEQCLGTREVDHRSDIYSLGIILFEMLAGRPPFISEAFGELLVKHLSEPPPSLRGFAPKVTELPLPGSLQDIDSLSQIALLHIVGKGPWTRDDLHKDLRGYRHGPSSLLEAGLIREVKGQKAKVEVVSALERAATHGISSRRDGPMVDKLHLLLATVSDGRSIEKLMRDWRGGWDTITEALGWLSKADPTVKELANLTIRQIATLGPDTGPQAIKEQLKLFGADS